MKKRPLLSLIAVFIFAILSFPVSYPLIAKQVIKMREHHYSCAHLPHDQLSGMKTIYLYLAYNPYMTCTPKEACLRVETNKEGSTLSYNTDKKRYAAPTALTDKGAAAAVKEFLQMRSGWAQGEYGVSAGTCPLPEIKIVETSSELKAVSKHIKGNSSDAALSIEVRRFSIFGSYFFYVTMDVRQGEPVQWFSWGGPWLMPENVTTRDWAAAMYKATVIPSDGTIVY